RVGGGHRSGAGGEPVRHAAGPRDDRGAVLAARPRRHCVGGDDPVAAVEGSAAVSDVGRVLRAEWDRVAGYGSVAAGVVLLVAGFVGVRTSADVIDEISYLVTGGIGSIFLLGVGATMLLSAHLHDDFRKLHRVEENLDRVERLLRAQHPDLLDTADPPPDRGPQGSAMPAANADRNPAVVAGVRATLAVRRGRLFASIGM